MNCPFPNSLLPWRWRQQVPPKTGPYLLTTQKPLISIAKGCENLRSVLKRRKFLGKQQNSWEETEELVKT
jgi:hypothetical protein